MLRALRAGAFRANSASMPASPDAEHTLDLLQGLKACGQQE
jgi:hypothetical protein